LVASGDGKQTLILLLGDGSLVDYGPRQFSTLLGKFTLEEQSRLEVYRQYAKVIRALNDYRHAGWKHEFAFEKPVPALPTGRLFSETETSGALFMA
jgi:hypothetical protein